jgi:ankyrin repeat protein
MNFGDSLNTCTMPDVASTLVSTIPPSESQDTIEALLQHFGCDSPRLLLEPRLVESNSARLDTPLHMAVRRGSAKIVQLLLQHGADCNARGAQSMTPLAYAIIGNHESVADMLLSRGAQVLAMDDQQRSALHLAVMHRRERLLRTLVCHCGRNSGVLDECDMEGKTPLHIAISMDLDSAVEVLCEAGANVQLQPGLRSTLAA